MHLLEAELGFFDEDLLELPEAVRMRLAAETIEVFRARGTNPAPQVLPNDAQCVER